MNTKLNKYLIIIGAICTIIPLNILLIGRGINNSIVVCVPMVIGYMLYLVQYKKYSEKQKKLLKIACCISIVNIVSAIWNECIGDIHIDTFGAIPLNELISAILLDISYVAHRIFSLLLCINVLKSNWSKAKILLTIGIGIIVWIIFTNVWVIYNFNKMIDIYNMN